VLGDTERVEGDAVITCCHQSTPPPISARPARLAQDLIKSASEVIAEVEGLGGMAKAIESGMPKLRIEEAAARKQARIDSGQDTIVGVNKYRLAKEETIPVLQIDNTAVRTKQIEQLNRVRFCRHRCRPFAHPTVCPRHPCAAGESDPRRRTRERRPVCLEGQQRVDGVDGQGQQP